MADPATWGPGLWKYLHALPKYSESVDSLKATLHNLDLPCPECRSHYKEYITERPINIIQTRDAGQRWIFDLHNSVNKRLGKPLYPYKSCLSDCEKIGEHSHQPQLLF